MKKQATKRQKQLLEIIYDFIKNKGYPPSFNEMRGSLNVISNQTVLDHLNKLVEVNLIKKNKSAARGISILPAGYEVLNKPPLVGFLGMTSAGVPMEAVENFGQWREIPSIDEKLSRLDDVFLLKVSGDSMINAGIEDGDVLLIKNEKEFYSGDIVLVQIGDDSTVKRFVSDDKPPFVYLKPENPEYPITPFNEHMKMTGKVISILKNGHWKPIKKIRNAYTKTKQIKRHYNQNFPQPGNKVWP